MNVSGNYLLILSVIGNVIVCGLFIYVMIADQNKIEKLKTKIKELENN